MGKNYFALGYYLIVLAFVIWGVLGIVTNMPLTTIEPSTINHLTP